MKKPDFLLHSLYKIGKKSIIPILLTLPCLISTIIINNLDIPAKAIIYDGSIKILWRNLALLVTAPYLFFVFLALGDLFGFSNKKINRYYDPIESWIITLFSGVCVLTIMGAALGLLSWLNPKTLISLTCLASFTFFFRNPNFLCGLYEWITAQDQKEEPFVLRGILISIRASTPLVLCFLMTSQLWKLNPDVYQFYLPYFELVKLHQSTLLDPAIRDGFGFIVSRGRGVLLFFTSLTCSEGLGIVSYLYAFLTGIIIRQITVRLLAGLSKSILPLQYTKQLVSDLCMLFAFWTTATVSRSWEVNVGHTHVETGALLLFLFWITFLSLYLDKEVRGKTLLRTLVLPALALPLMLPGSTLIIAITLLSPFLYFLKSKDFTSSLRLSMIGTIAILSTICSLLINQFYLGLAEVNPYQLFLPFANLKKLSQWTSIEFIYYVNSAQGIEYSPKLNLSGLIKLSASLRDRLWNIVLDFPTTPAQEQFYFVLFMIYLSYSMTIPFKRTSKEIYHSWILLLTYIGITSFVVVFTSHGSLIRLMGFQVAFGPLLLFLPLALISMTPDPQMNRRFYFTSSLVIALSISCTLPGHIGWPLALTLTSLGTMLYNLNSNSKIALIPVRLLPALDSKFKFMVTLVAAFLLTFNNAKIPSNRIYYPGVYSNIGEDTYEQHKKVQTYSTSLQVFLGKTGLAGLAPWLKKVRCEQYNSIIPLNKPIYPLNAVASIEPLCYGSPLLARTKIIETLHPPFARDFRHIMLGTPEEAIATFKKWNVDFFLVEKDEIRFWAAGSSDVFSGENLLKKFDIYFEDPSILIFTWKGKGFRSVTAEEAQKMDLWRNPYVTGHPGPGHLREWDKQNRESNLRAQQEGIK